MPAPLSYATRTIKSPIDEVWAIVAAYGSESLWFPNVAKSTLKGFGVGSTRSLWFSNGPQGNDSWDEKPVRELLVAADGDEYTLRWQIFNDHISNVESFSGIKLESLRELETKMSWHGKTDMPNGPQRDGMKVFIEAMYEGAMEAIAKKLEKSAEA
ncbi:hypothetical protein ACHAQH_006427 [Verticillium albo-atrum]